MTLCLIAGQGRLPSLLLERLEATGAAPLLAALEGVTIAGAQTRPVTRFRIERLGSFLADLTARGVSDVCFAGAIRRPALDAGAVDPATMPLVPRMVQALGQGDDAALRMVLSFFEEAGLRIVAAHDVLPDLLPPTGVATRTQPGAASRRDAERAAVIAAALGAADLGQACVVAGGQAIALEGLPGTDWMLASVARLRDVKQAPKSEAADPLSWMVDSAADWLSASDDGDPLHLPGLPKGGILFKAPKPGQDRRIDLPAIGQATVRAAAAARLEGIAIEAGGVLVLDAPGVVDLADRLGLFLWVRAPE